MSKKTHPALIGAFVVGALLLAAAAVVILGGGRWLTPKNKFVMYFPGSVAGLQVGAPVNFRGVKIGAVSDILVELDNRDASVRTPVFVEIEPRRISATGSAGEIPLSGSAERTMARLVERGLRARLRTVSLVTGQVVVELDFYPETPIERVGAEHPFPELPTISSPLEELTNTLAGLPIEELVASLLTTVRTLEELLSQPAVGATPGLLNETLSSLRGLIGNLDRRLEPLTASLERIPESADATLAEVRELARSTDERLVALTADLEQTSRAARQTLEQVEKTFAGLEGTSAELEYQLTVTLREIAAAARSLELLAETLERQPEALLRGKRKGG